MQCPKCQSQFEKVQFAEIEVDRCLTCRGLWFDMLEKDDLVKMKGSEVIDIGSAEIGEQYSQQQRVKCPSCEIDMIRMVDKDQFHIKYEYCPSCYGSFFDAGEFRDLKEHTVMERFFAMVKTVRGNL